MRCDDCNATIEPDDLRDHLGRNLCEDCYMVALSPMKTCDPWAVHSAKSYEQHAGDNRPLTPLQNDILRILKAEGPLEPVALQQKLDGDGLQGAFRLQDSQDVILQRRQGTIIAGMLFI